MPLETEQLAKHETNVMVNKICTQVD